VEKFAIDIWNSVVEKQAGKNLTAVANGKRMFLLMCYGLTIMIYDLTFICLHNMYLYILIIQ